MQLWQRILNYEKISTDRSLKNLYLSGYLNIKRLHLTFLLIFERRKISRKSGRGENELTNLHTCVEMCYARRQEFYMSDK